jgi:hypothetical protein
MMLPNILRVGKQIQTRFINISLATVIGFSGLAGALPFFFFSGSAGAAPAPTVYDATPNPLPPNLASLGFEATSTSEFGDYVHLAGSSRTLKTATVTMSDWALYSDYSSNPDYMSNNVSWTHPLTLNIYSNHLGGNGAPDTLLATNTQVATIPWRPAADSTCPGGTAWRASDSNCYNGLAFNVTFDLSGLNTVLPNDVIVTMAYNTADYGASPIHQAGPYNSLNVGIPSGQLATVGTDDSANNVFWNTSFAGFYTDGGASGVGFLRLDTNWSPNGTVAFQITAASPSTIYVNSSWSAVPAGQDPDGAGPALQMGYDAFSSIAPALAAAPAGTTVNVAAGTYSNVNLSGTYSSNITVQGVGNPLINGLNLTGSIFNGLSFQGFTFTGGSSGYGNFSVTIDNSGQYVNLAFNGDTFDGQSVDQRGAIFLNQGFTGFTLQNNVFQNYVSASAGDLYSIVFAEAQNGAGNNYLADSNTLTNSNAKNFLEAYRWQNVTYQNNVVNADLGRLLVWSDNTQSLGTVTISNNTSHLTQGVGIGVFYTPATTANVTSNTVAGADTCLVINEVSSSNVTNNSFSCSTSNPAPQVVVTDPNQPVTVSSGSTNSTIDFSSLLSGNTATIPQTTMNTDNGSVSIPASTVVTASGGTWDGVITSPTILSNSSVSVPAPSGTTTQVATVIEVGAGNINLTFDKAARILMPGQAGKLVGFVRNGNFTQIANVCSADTQASGDALVAGGDCYISVGADMVVWTKHFTTFVTYSQTANPTSGGSSSSSSSTSSSSKTSTATPTTFASAADVAQEVLGTNTATQTNQDSTTDTQTQTPSTATVSSSNHSMRWYLWILAALLIAAVVIYVVYRVADTTKTSGPK